MEIIENFLFQNGNQLAMTFENGCAVEITIDSTINKHDFKEVLRDIVLPFYCKKYVNIRVYGPKGDMTRNFFSGEVVSPSEIVDVLLKVRDFSFVG